MADTLETLLAALNDTSDPEAAAARIKQIALLLSAASAEVQSDGITKLAALRQDRDWHVRRAAETALEQLGTAAAKAALTETAPKPDALVGIDKAQALFRRIAGTTGEQWKTGELPEAPQEDNPPEAKPSDEA